MSAAERCSGVRVALVSSGTGGHLWPALVLADALRHAGHDSVLITEGRRVEREILDGAGATAIDLPLGRGWRRLLSLPGALLRTRRLLARERVGCVIGTGGAIAGVVGVAARSLGLPLYLVEMNAVLGRGNKWLLPFAERVFLSLPLHSPKEASAPRSRRFALTGAPVRADLDRWSRDQACQRLGLDPARPVLLVTGGSQGARVLNESTPLACRQILRDGWVPSLQVVHLAGTDRDESVRSRYLAVAGDFDRGVLEHRVRPICSEMAPLFAAADLVLSRSGGGTVAELMAVGRPAVLVPYPHHRDQQQRRNGAVLVDAGAAEMLDEGEVTPDRLAKVVGRLLAAASARQRMADAARALCPGGASGAVGRILDIVGVGLASQTGSGVIGRPRPGPDEGAAA